MGITVATSYRSVKRYVSAILRGRRGPSRFTPGEADPSEASPVPKEKGLRLRVGPSRFIGRVPPQSTGKR